MARQIAWVRLGNEDGCDECRRQIEPGELVLVQSGLTVFFCSESCHQAFCKRSDALGALIDQHSKPTTPEQHRLRIARDTLRMPDAMAGVMGGMSKHEARRLVA